MDELGLLQKSMQITRNSNADIPLPTNYQSMKKVNYTRCPKKKEYKKFWDFSKIGHQGIERS